MLNADNETIRQEIIKLLDQMGFGNEVEDVEIHQGVTRRFTIHIRGADNELMENENEGRTPYTNLLIGERGNNLVALEHLLKKIIQKKYGEETSASLATQEKTNEIKTEMDESVKLPEGGFVSPARGFTLDINDYRVRRLEFLKQDVKVAAKEARVHKKGVMLSPMSSFERRIVHMLLAEYPDITTESVGEEPSRRVIIKPYP